MCHANIWARSNPSVRSARVLFVFKQQIPTVGTNYDRVCGANVSGFVPAVGLCASGACSGFVLGTEIHCRKLASACCSEPALCTFDRQDSVALKQNNNNNNPVFRELELRCDDCCELRRRGAGLQTDFWGGQSSHGLRPHRLVH